MKTFDWEFRFSETKNKDKWEWVKSIQNKPISETEFVGKMTTQPRYGRRPHKKYSPSNLKKTYKRLKEDFGFFK